MGIYMYDTTQKLSQLCRLCVNDTFSLIVCVLPNLSSLHMATHVYDEEQLTFICLVSGWQMDWNFGVLSVLL